MYEELKQIIEESNKIVFFGGAGVSTESGIPDFRSETGLYNAKQDYGRSPEEMLSGDFCRGCGYCLPCPAGIYIPDCARMSLYLRRAPLSVYLGEEYKEKMAKVKDCLHCGQCKKKCPYGLDTPTLLEKNYENFLTFL